MLLLSLFFLPNVSSQILVIFLPTSKKPHAMIRFVFFECAEESCVFGLVNNLESLNKTVSYRLDRDYLVSRFIPLGNKKEIKDTVLVNFTIMLLFFRTVFLDFQFSIVNFIDSCSSLLFSLHNKFTLVTILNFFPSPFISALPSISPLFEFSQSYLTYNSSTYSGGTTELCWSDGPGMYSLITERRF